MSTQAPPAFHLMAKPTGAVCNLDCSYCFFLSKEMLYPGSRFRNGTHVQAAAVQPPTTSTAAAIPAAAPDSPGAPADIMGLHAAEDAQHGRNDPCTCGSVRKWKYCHGAGAVAQE